MKVITRQVMQMNDDGSFTLLEQDSHEYNGPVAKCFGGDSDTSSNTTTTTDIDTTQVGIESVEGLGIAAAGDVDFHQEIQQTDHGAVAGAFDFAEELGGGAFEFAGDVARQAGETSQRAVEISRQAAATAVTGGQSDIAGINAKTIGFVMAGLAAIFIIPKLIKGA